MLEGGPTGAPQFTPTWQQPQQQQMTVAQPDFALPQQTVPQGAAPAYGAAPLPAGTQGQPFDPRRLPGGDGFMPRRKSWRDYAPDLISSALIGTMAGQGGSVLGGAAAAGITTLVKELMKNRKPKTTTKACGGMVKKNATAKTAKAKGGKKRS